MLTTLTLMLLLTILTFASASFYYCVCNKYLFVQKITGVQRSCFVNVLKCFSYVIVQLLLLLKLNRTPFH